MKQFLKTLGVCICVSVGLVILVLGILWIPSGLILSLDTVAEGVLIAVFVGIPGGVVGGVMAAVAMKRSQRPVSRREWIRRGLLAGGLAGLVIGLVPTMIGEIRAGVFVAAIAVLGGCAVGAAMGIYAHAVKRGEALAPKAEPGA